jgi:NADH-quinone oxidoreductase subunit C
LPDATGLELIAADLRERFGDEAVAGTEFFRERASISIAPPTVHEVLRYLKEEAAEPVPHLMSVHGCDYFPEEPRLCVHYELLSMERVERLNVKTRMGTGNANVPSVVDLFPTANYQEREVYDMFGVEFDGHPDPRRILMPEDYVGHPQRRDFPMGGEPVIFTYNENEMPRWYD